MDYYDAIGYCRTDCTFDEQTMARRLSKFAKINNGTGDDYSGGKSVIVQKLTSSQQCRTPEMQVVIPEAASSYCQRSIKYRLQLFCDLNMVAPNGHNRPLRFWKGDNHHFEDSENMEIIFDSIWGHTCLDFFQGRNFAPPPCEISDLLYHKISKNVKRKIVSFLMK